MDALELPCFLFAIGADDAGAAAEDVAGAAARNLIAGNLTVDKTEMKTDEMNMLFNVKDEDIA